MRVFWSLLLCGAAFAQTTETPKVVVDPNGENLELYEDKR